MASKYADLWVSRDSDIEYVSETVCFWSGEPVKNSFGIFNAVGSEELLIAVVSTESFAKTAGWTPRKGRKYPVTIEIKRKGK